MKNIFFFGAGAEDTYGLPLGGEYVLDTMMTKKPKLYDELEIFYEGSKIKYQKEFLFSSNSNTFANILLDAYKTFVNEDNYKKDENCLIEKIFNDVDFKYDESKEKEDILKKIKYNLSQKKDNRQLFDIIINREYNDSKLDKFFENLKYYGTIEKDFSCLLDYNVYIKRTSRLINYFWSCYFSIFIPYLKAYCGEDKSYKELFNKENGKYKFLKIIEELKKANISDFKTKNNEKSYYQVIAEKYTDNSIAITTNYTFFVEKAFKNNIYLAGKLDEFEEIDTFMVSNELSNNSIPFLYTQAPIKPIIAYKTIEKYYNAMNEMKDANNVFVIGYGFCNEDSHIKTLFLELRQQNKNLNIIYCDYESNVEKNSKFEEYLKKLNAKIESYNNCEELMKIIDKYQIN